MASSLVGLEDLLTHEFSAAERYRRFLSLVTVHAPDSSAKIHTALSAATRGSDVLFDLDFGACIVMTGTSRMGALSAIKRYARITNYSPDIRYTVATFPGDCSSPMELLQCAIHRLPEAKKNGAESNDCHRDLPK